MKKNKLNEIAAVFVMLVLVCFGYTIFYNNAFSGYETQGTNIWLSAATVKFVNNWLKEGPIKLNFIMYEYPDSIEFNSLDERDPYISYPPGSIVPPYILAKLLHESEIQVGFIKNFLRIKFLFDTMLVCLIVFSILQVTLRLQRYYLNIAISVVLALLWMCIPINLYYLRNIYFADQAIITVVLAFVLLEIYDGSVKKKPIPIYALYFSLKFFVSLYGVLTDYYFWFVLFISWLVKIIPMIKQKDKVKRIISASLVYVLPVFMGIGLFFAQIRTIPNYGNILLNKMNARTFGYYEGSKLLGIIISFIYQYSFGLLLIALLIAYAFIKNIRDKSFLKKYKALLSIMAIIYLPPVLQVLVFQQHSAIHEFSLLKFGLPLILAMIIFTVFALDLKKMSDASIVIQIKNGENLQSGKIPLLYSIIIAASILFCGVLNMNKGYFNSRFGGAPISYERENLIRLNYSYNDVYFSFTESIEANPPHSLSISKKLIYKVDSVSKIFQRFPNLNPDARILLIVNKDVSSKSEQIIENEQFVRKTSPLLFSSQNYEVYAIESKF